MSKRKSTDEDGQAAIPDTKELIRRWGWTGDEAYNVDYVQGVFEAAGGVSGVSDAVIELLRSDGREEANAGLMFLQDVICFGLTARSQAYRLRAAALPSVAGLLAAPDENLRHNAINTLGKIGPRTNADFLVRVFPQYLESDPINLPGLLSDLLWLKRDAFTWPYVEAVLNSPSYLARWSLLKFAEQFVVEPDSRRGRRIGRLLQTLSADEHPLVREEAIYRLEQFKAGPPKLPPGMELIDTPESRAAWLEWSFQKAKELRQGEPELTFVGVSISFSSYLRVAKRRDYDVETLDAFVQYRRTHPYKPASTADVDRYMQKFIAFLRRRRRPGTQTPS